MESGGEGPARADGERVLADPSNVIYLVEDIKPDVSNLSCEGVVHDCLLKREDQEELLCSNTHYNDAKTGTSEDDVTVKIENFDVEQLHHLQKFLSWHHCLSLIHIPSPRDKRQSRMPSSA